MQKLAALLTASLLLGCTAEFDTSERIQSNVTSGSVMASKVDLNLHPMNKIVCDPFEGGNNTQVMTQGVLGRLFYKTASMPIFHIVDDYINFAKQSDKTLFFSDINVPTRMFSEGFSTQTTGLLKDDSGNKLIEYFGIKFESSLQLSEDDEEGVYELALLSDDGTRLKIKDPIDDTWKEIINNDGDHPTKMGCASRTIQMTKRTSLPMELVYYQGPRFHISNVLIWRKTTEAGKDSLCGHSGNEYFFDPNNQSIPLQPYKDLLARGWKPLSTGNFWINNTTSYNPCVEGTAPVINNFRIAEVALTDVFLAWETDIAASTQIRLVNKTTHEETLTSADNLLRTNHEIHLRGLQPKTTYSAQAVSISQDLGKAMSNEVTFTTP
ncbi:MAG: hypothetical protein IPM97_03675 [Bdellovibrionaceae bacterium]|nr:hypothetical protein [Pseudobdellovibrionaceae bacterium]